MSAKITFDGGKTVELSNETTEKLRKELGVEERFYIGSEFIDQHGHKHLLILSDGKVAFVYLEEYNSMCQKGRSRGGLCGGIIVYGIGENNEYITKLPTQYPEDFKLL